MPNSLRMQQAILIEKLHSLRQSRGGYAATMSKMCSRIDELLRGNPQLVGVRSLQSAFNAFLSLRDNVELTQGLLPQDSIELQDVLSYDEAQEVRKRIMKRWKNTPSTSPRFSIPRPLKWRLIRRYYTPLPRQDLFYRKVVRRKE